VRYGEGVAILVGDGLLAKAFRLAARDAGAAAVLAAAVEAMVEGQYLDITDADVDVLELQRLKTGALFRAAVRMPATLAGARAEEWEQFGEAFGRLFQLADDIADGDGAVDRYGLVRTHELADDQAALARGALRRVDADTSVVAQLLDHLAARAE
jgi:geranylgeranyl pyrophosphate synthase